MKVNVDLEIKDFDGSVIKDGEIPLTVKDSILVALKSHLKTDNEHTDRFELFQIGHKVNKGGTLELTAEEITLIKKRINECFTAVIVGNVFNALEDNK
jgi:hypothetical protein